MHYANAIINYSTSNSMNKQYLYLLFWFILASRDIRLLKASAQYDVRAAQITVETLTQQKS